MTVVQANQRAVNATIGREGSIGQNSLEQKAQMKQFGNQMRSANFKMGSILPENHDNYRVSGLERNNSGAIGLKNNNFKPMARQQPIKSQEVSAGNNIARGNGNFKTVNQEFTHWIQPALAK